MRTDHSIQQLCQTLQVSVSGYYQWSQRAASPGPRAVEDQGLAREIEVIHARSRRTYGSPRMVAALRGRGRRHGRNRVARLMREQDLCGRYRVQANDSKP